MSQKTTVFLKSIAIVLLLVGHAAYKQLIHVPSLRNIGAFAVTIFLCVSAVGLYTKYGDAIKKDFLVKRMRKIYIPYLLFAPISIFLYIYTHKSVHVKAIALYLLGLDYTRSIDPTMWYIAFILATYLLFFIIFKLKVSKGYKVILFFLASMFLCRLNFGANYPEISWQFKLHAFDFPVGLALAYAMNYKDVLRKYSYPLCLLLLATGVYGLPYDTLTKQAIAGLSFGMLVCILATKLVEGKDSKWLGTINLLGNISYEIYLVEWIVLSVVLGKFNFQHINFIEYILMTLVAAIILSFLSKKFANLLDSVVNQIQVKKTSISIEESAAAPS